MPLLGSAALLLSFDVAPDAIAEHDDWHTHEHLPERLSIPGFLRGSRWVATRGHPRYLVLYEVADLATMTSAAYLERLNHPTAWTSKMMPHYRDMTRGLCAVSGSAGLGLGGLAYVVRFRADPGSHEGTRDWLLHELVPKLPAQRGLGSAHLLEGAIAAPMTKEQRIRGTDAAIDSALLVTGYEEEALLRLEDLGLAQRGAVVARRGLYRLACVLTSAEVVT